MKSYGQFCPVAKGSEVFGERWTPLIIRELLCGSHRFNELKRGNPLMSPSILSQRLKSLEDAGVVEKRAAPSGDGFEYYLTAAGEDLGQIVVRLGIWGDKWARARLEKDDYDPLLLMWDVRRRIDVNRFPDSKTVLHFLFLDMPPKKRAWWLVVENGEVDLCMKDPGFEVDLTFRSSARIMGEIWSGYTTVRKEVRKKNLQLLGKRTLKEGIEDWLGYSVFTDPEALLSS